MNYIAYHFTVHPPQPGSEILIALIADRGFDSFDYTETGFTAYIPAGDTRIDFSELQFEDFTYSYTIENIHATNWNAEWEKNFEPVIVSDLLCIRAPFHQKYPNTKHEIIIMPKMSFGTGHHQTTRLMCLQLFNTDVKHKRVLDMGCGTGILAILSKMLGAGEVTGIDIDEWSVENALENCSVNGYHDIILKQGNAELLKNEKPFELILANINKNVLKSDIPTYSGVMQQGGTLLLSGFFTTDVEELTSIALEHGFSCISSDNENEWAVIVLKKK